MNRKLNGPQTTGRDYRNLSEPQFEMQSDLNNAVSMRDGVDLMADVYRPRTQDPVPALLAVSCYPRQIQLSGAPLGFVEAGATDFWVERGYAHVIANTRGTGGSGGTFGWLDQTEREDMADLVEWVAAQPWCSGEVGMIGISYFAMAQLAAACEAPEHLRAIFPVATTADPCEAVWHNGLLSNTFVSSWVAGVATLADKSDSFFRNDAVGLLSRILRTPKIHEKFTHMNGEAALAVLGGVMRAHFAQEPWGDLLQALSTEHQVHDDYWAERNMLSRLRGSTIPTYLGCDWENVPLHLPSTFTTWGVLESTAPVRMGMLGAQGLTWPWESLHVEALAWFDHWLKGRDTGILDGPPIRYWLPEADEFRTADSWPPPETSPREFWLSSMGLLVDEPVDGSRSYLHQGAGVALPKGAPPPRLPSKLTWDTPVLKADVDMVGNIEFILDAAITATDTSWIVTLQDVAPSGSTYDVTAGWLRASQRGRSISPITPGETVSYPIEMVPNARRFKKGHKIRLVIASDDTTEGHPAIMKFQHQAVGQQSVNTVMASSRLVLPLLQGVK